MLKRNLKEVLVWILSKENASLFVLDKTVLNLFATNTD